MITGPQDLLFGETAAFWIELKKRAETLDVTTLMRDIADLSAKVAYYENRLDEIQRFRKSVNERSQP